MPFVSQQITDEKRTCYKHRSRPTNLLCARCARPICWECLVDAPVGFQCRRCTKEKVKPAGAVAKVHRRRRVKRGVTKVVRTVLGFALIVAAVAGYVWVQGSPGREPSTAKPAVAAPLPGPAADPAGFKFLQVDAKTAAPIRFNPCQTVQYVVNPDGAPAGGLTAVNQAIGAISQATGIQFASAGITSETGGAERPNYQPSYGQTWAPVLIAWKHLGKADGADHGFAGVGGPQAPVLAGTTYEYVSGFVLMNADDPVPANLLRPILMHELGHVMGLDHVSLPQDIMDPAGTVTPNQTWGPGDLAGLQKVGKAAGCLPEPKPGPAT